MKLNKEFEIFACSIGDSDDSFDIRLYKNGKMVREVVVEDTKYNGGQISVNRGRPLEGERESLKLQGITQRVIAIATHMGINTNHKLEEIKAFYRNQAASEGFQFNDDEY